MLQSCHILSKKGCSNFVPTFSGKAGPKAVKRWNWTCTCVTWCMLWFKPGESWDCSHIYIEVFINLIMHLLGGGGRGEGMMRALFGSARTLTNNYNYLFLEICQQIFFCLELPNSKTWNSGSATNANYGAILQQRWIAIWQTKKSSKIASWLDGS